LALITVPIHLVRPVHVSKLLASMVLSGISAIYLGFAIAEGSTRGILLQSAICIAFIAAASAAYLLAPLALPVLYILHGLWDVAHFRTSLPMPGWYVPLCLVYDLLAALSLWAIWLL
jgi:hypothetical protein